MEPKIIFEDEELLVLEKPAGRVVNRAETTREGETVQEWVEQKLKIKNEKLKIDEESDFYKRAGIVHRLDKETSGLLLVAKTQEAFEDLQRQFKERKVKKKYLALVSGKVEPPEGEISAPVGRLPWDREKFGVFPGGREAKTKYKVVKHFEWEARLRSGKWDKKSHISPQSPASHFTPHTSFSLLELTPTTGRTHQIRVHLKYLGHTVVGDQNYAGRKKAREQRKWCPRLFLHAASLKFIHPKTGKEMVFESDLPKDLKSILDRSEVNG